MITLSSNAITTRGARSVRVMPTTGRSLHFHFHYIWRMGLDFRNRCNRIHLHDSYPCVNFHLEIICDSCHCVMKPYSLPPFQTLLPCHFLQI
ncbi:hypothetical protein TSMEX_003068 [Taenia solium]